MLLAMLFQPPKYPRNSSHTCWREPAPGKDILIGDFFMKTAAGQSLSIHHSNSACLASLQPKGSLEIHGTTV